MGERHPRAAGWVVGVEQRLKTYSFKVELLDDTNGVGCADERGGRVEGDAEECEASKVGTRLDICVVDLRIHNGEVGENDSADDWGGR